MDYKKSKVKVVKEKYIGNINNFNNTLSKIKVVRGWRQVLRVMEVEKRNQVVLVKKISFLMLSIEILCALSLINQNKKNQIW